MPTLSDRERELFTEPNFAAFATMTEDGTPHVSTVWVDVDGDLILVNSAEGRSKTENARSRPEAGVSVFRMSNPYENVSVRGRIVEVTTDGAEAHIDAMAKKYLGQDEYPYRAPGEERVLIKIRPDVVTSLFMEG
jgi:PPOX class probable F420-dependent enzyme